MTGKLYDRLKFVALIGLPALATLYFTVAAIWGLPYGEQIVGTITALDTALGVVVKYLANQHDKIPEILAGDLVVTDNPEDGNREMYLAMSQAGYDLLPKSNRVTLKVIQK